MQPVELIHLQASAAAASASATAAANSATVPQILPLHRLHQPQVVRTPRQHRQVLLHQPQLYMINLMTGI